ncbi:Monooxygenase, FAD-binding protein [Cordyceps fumosorosea ARSEF 2679]|uniref:Monooxygenase, FAD-binding protein n=1 Tax=Cordyceps fumosorosea (strain ARSEF 2679) TaxID=1081104 RepID=A0A162M9M9_CORFA|nr:Monooxygenase, FAD-binding protein [Cordyceps fumosorosea ARSEF 2679]OAA53000.1 Monooxygenase, FAD-binding protein [Cordyceps fumosorosea ARSEF 2679]
MKQHYSTFDPTIQKVLAKVENCLGWKLADIPPLPQWLGKSGRGILMGDAAHAMLPYLAHGAATSTKDGTALAECISRALRLDDIPKVLPAFQEIRKPRCEIIQAGSRANGDIWHLPDRSEQERCGCAMGGETGDSSDAESNSNH